MTEKRQENHVGGAWRGPSSGAWMDVCDPSDRRTKTVAVHDGG